MARAWAAVAVLCLAQVVAYVDRGILALVIDPVRADLGIGDVQIAVLQGFAFAVFYVSVGLPLGHLADRVNRRMLLAAGIVVWSAATIGCGLSRGFGDMFVGRLFIGVGEAVLGPCAVGIIAEMFLPERRGRPMALYVLGSMVAYGVGSTLCGMILQAVPAGFFAGWPVVDGLAAWRVAFVVLGACGLPVALLLWLVGDGSRSATLKAQAAPTGPIWPALAARAGVLVPLYLSAALFALGAAAITGWSAAMLTRQMGIAATAVGKELGLFQIAWALIGAGLAALIVDRVAARYGTAGKVTLAGIVALATLPSALAYAMPGPLGAMVLAAQVMGASALYGTTMLSVISEIVPAQSRGLAVAFYAFVMTMIGGSLGPLAVAGLTARVFSGPAATGQSIATVAALALGGCLIAALIAARSISRMKAPA
ncbi:MFS transporter [Novosphingobium sp. FSY-8]|uniref:MFS transporter n=1 Tax=Novosphingobium ovatum TaxID=1908523 RepID=A0ABW9XA20_9SPHN|nr:MFS transporter [Novosphingobium ovatum]NBC35357.1 MFS transporter [Novosphingobium ovatum]